MHYCSISFIFKNLRIDSPKELRECLLDSVNFFNKRVWRKHVWWFVEKSTHDFIQIYLVINFILQSYFQRTKDKSVDLICIYMINPKQEIQAYANTFFTNMKWNRHVHFCHFYKWCIQWRTKQLLLPANTDSPFLLVIYLLTFLCPPPFTSNKVASANLDINTS